MIATKEFLDPLICWSLYVHPQLFSGLVLSWLDTGTGKTTTLVALLNALHLRQYQRYYSEIENITTSGKGTGTNEDLVAIRAASKVKPRILVCAPSNAAVDNIILKIIKIQFVDGIGKKYR